MRDEKEVEAMDAFDAVRARRSIRKYLERGVEWEKVAQVLDSARLAPSAGNLQDWRLILVTEQESIKAIAEACQEQYWIQTAPVLIVVCSEPKKGERFYGERGNTLYRIQNTAAAIQNMLLTATAQGLGSCWIGAFEEDAVKRALKIPDEIAVHALVTIGYADETPAKLQKQTLDEVVFVEKYGNRIADIAAYAGYYNEHLRKAARKGRELFEKLARKAQKV